MEHFLQSVLKRPVNHLDERQPRACEMRSYSQVDFVRSDSTKKIIAEVVRYFSNSLKSRIVHSLGVVAKESRQM